MQHCYGSLLFDWSNISEYCLNCPMLPLHCIVCVEWSMCGDDFQRDWWQLKPVLDLNLGWNNICINVWHVQPIAIKLSQSLNLIGGGLMSYQHLHKTFYKKTENKINVQYHSTFLNKLEGSNYLLFDHNSSFVQIHVYTKCIVIFNFCNI